MPFVACPLSILGVLMTTTTGAPAHWGCSEWMSLRQEWLFEMRHLRRARVQRDRDHWEANRAKPCATCRPRPPPRFREPRRKARSPFVSHGASRSGLREVRDQGLTFESLPVVSLPSRMSSVFAFPTAPFIPPGGGSAHTGSLSLLLGTSIRSGVPPGWVHAGCMGLRIFVFLACALALVPGDPLHMRLRKPVVLRAMSSWLLVSLCSAFVVVANCIGVRQCILASRCAYGLVSWSISLHREMVSPQVD